MTTVEGKTIKKNVEENGGLANAQVLHFQGSILSASTRWASAIPHKGLAFIPIDSIPCTPFLLTLWVSGWKWRILLRPFQREAAYSFSKHMMEFSD